MTRSIYLIALFLCSMMVTQNVFGQHKVIWYTNGEANFVVMRNGKIEETKPLGTRAMFLYDTFFKTYEIVWLDEDSHMINLKFRYIKAGKNGSIVVKETTTKEDFFLDDSNLSSDGYVTVGVGVRSSSGEKIISEESRLYVLRNLKFNKIEEK